LSRSSPLAAGYDRETLKFLRSLSFNEIEALFDALYAPLEPHNGVALRGRNLQQPGIASQNCPHR
jgi:hypothetical protein